MEPKPPFISRVVLKNYKSIARCDVKLGALQFLVGRNGSGKSNFLDVLAFVRDLFTHSNIRDVLQDRSDILHRENFATAFWGGTFTIHLECNLPGGATAVLTFSINAIEAVVEAEKCVITKNGKQIAKYETGDGKVLHEMFSGASPAPTDCLYMHRFSSEAYRLLQDGLRRMRIYRLMDIDKMRNLMHSFSGEFSLSESGDNIGAVLHSQPEVRDRINEYMQIIIPSVSGVGVKQLPGADRLLLLEFLMNGGKGNSASFHAPSMSDGTLRALGILTALLQKQKNGDNNFPSLVAIEEPENGLHARAFGALLCAMQEASDMRQVIVATHSADMLDDKDITPEQILPVEFRDSQTIIAPLRNLEKEMLHDHLTTGGELLRQDKLKPAESSPVADGVK